MSGSSRGVTLRQVHRLFNDGTLAALPDERLLERFAAERDGEAFEALVARHGPMVLGVCRAVLGDEHDAEDAFQATFLALARRAGAIQVRGTLGGWLYRVARRVAARTSATDRRRRVRERDAGEAAGRARDPGAVDRGSDALPILHEEIGRLPAVYREPVVLCYLEGLTYLEAAGQLRWTEPTLRTRLARARERLRDRLTRRGVTGAGALVVAALAERPGWAEPPPSLVRSTVEAAVRGTVGIGGAAILAARLRSALALALPGAAGIAVVLAGVAALALALGARRTDEGRPASAPAAAGPGADPAATPAPERPGGTVDVRGRVVDPSGAPVAGATIRVDYYAYRDKPPEGGEPSASSAPDGQFTLVAPREDLERYARGDTRFAPRLLAAAPGFGLGSAEVANQSGVLRDVTVRLVPDDLPIEGRVIDLEGRPVADAEVVTSDLYEPPGGDLSPFIADMKANPTGPNDAGLRQLPFKIRRTTGPDGRFRLDGVGRERLVMFTVAGPTVALTRTFAMTRDTATLSSSNSHIVGPRTMLFHGARFDFVVAPCKPVAGTVRDLDTGAPVAGIRIHGMPYDPRSRTYYHEVASTTDDQGRYRIVGMPRADKYRLFVFPAKGLPYCNAEFLETVDAPGLDEATVDLKLKRGALVRGRVADKVTGKPVRGASVVSLAMKDNPRVGEFPGFGQSYETRAYTDDEGRFEIAAVPGRGLLMVRALSDRYLTGVIAGTIPGYDPSTSLPAVPAFHFAESAHLVAPFDARPGTDPVTVDLQLDPGRSLTVTAVDPDGMPLPGCRVFGAHALTYWDLRPLDLATFEATSLDPRTPRLLMVIHEGRNLGGWLLIDKDASGPLKVALRPCGVVSGRLVDEEGRPRTRVELINMRFADTPPHQGVFHRRFPVDGDGRFRIEVIPGLNYSAYPLARSDRLLGSVFRDVKLDPGERKDLGDVVMKAR